MWRFQLHLGRGAKNAKKKESESLREQKMMRAQRAAIGAATRTYRRQNHCRQPLCEPQLDHLLAPLASGATRTCRKPLLG
jgi:hypothetical protein